MQHGQCLGGLVGPLKAAGQRDGHDDQLAGVLGVVEQGGQPGDVPGARLGQRVRRAHHRVLVGGWHTLHPGEQRLPERALEGGGQVRGHPELPVGQVVLADPLQPQPPAQQQADPVEHVHGDLVRPAALAHRHVRPGQHLVGQLVHAQLGEHQADVGQREGQGALVGPVVAHAVRRQFLVEHGQGAGGLGERGVLGPGGQCPAGPQCPGVRLQHGQPVPAGVGEHLVELGVGQIGQFRDDQPDHGRGAQQVRHDPGLAPPPCLGEQVVAGGEQVVRVGCLALRLRQQLTGPADQPGVGHLGKRW